MTIPVTDDELIMLWHTREPSHSIARRLCVTNEYLRRRWDNLRKVGKIPDGRRNASNPMTAASSGSGGDDYDGRPRSGEITDQDSGEVVDELVLILREHHNPTNDPLATPEGRPDLVNLKTRKEIFDERKSRGRRLEGGRGRDKGC